MIKFKKMYILRILFLFHVILSYSQIGYSGKITYQYDLDEISKSDNAMEQKIANTFFENLKNNKTKIKFELLFTQNESIYKMIKNMAVDKDKSLSSAILLTGGKEKVYTNTRKNESLRLKDFLGDFFLIKNNRKRWQLTQESKMIGKYNCIKAILINKENAKQLPTIAWYTPNIPVNIGPKGYGNLPGLILELKIGPIIYKATTIELNPKPKIKIEQPKSGNYVTEKEFEIILKDIMKKRNNE